MEIRITAGELLQRGCWDDACRLLGLNEWAVAEGRMQEDQELSLTENQAKRLGLMPGDPDPDDDEDMCVEATVRFLRTMRLVRITNVNDETEESDGEIVVFTECQLESVTIIADKEDCYDLQFSDGTAILDVPKSCLEIIDDES